MYISSGKSMNIKETGGMTITYRLKQLKIPDKSCGLDWDVVRKSMCSTYVHNSASLKGVGE